VIAIFAGADAAAHGVALDMLPYTNPRRFRAYAGELALRSNRWDSRNYARLDHGDGGATSKYCSCRGRHTSACYTTRVWCMLRRSGARDAEISRGS